MNNKVRPKKHLGQHFLADKNIAEKVAKSLITEDDYVIEIGPGMGSLTGYLLDLFGEKLWVVEIDKESVDYLNLTFPGMKARIIEGDFLDIDLQQVFNHKPISIIGNFPYNISSQILFKIIENRTQVTQAVGMFQKEVAKRICSPPGNKDYGILSVITQAFFDATYLFDVPPSVFVPPPEVNSGVLRLVRKRELGLVCDESLFIKVVKTAFNQRRKKLSNALSSINTNGKADKRFLDFRAEQLSWQDFVELTTSLQ